MDDGVVDLAALNLSWCIPVWLGLDTVGDKQIG
jgi:hypothetical protein